VPEFVKINSHRSSARNRRSDRLDVSHCKEMRGVRTLDVVEGFTIL
jgi:hypothetical protein